MARGVLEHRDDALGRRRDNRQPVGHAALVQRLERVFELADRELARDDPAVGPRAPRREPRGDLRIACHRAAPRPHRGQAVDAQRAARLRDQRRHPVAGEPFDPVALGAVVEQQDGRHGGGVEAVRQRQLDVGLRDARELQPRGLRSGVLGRGLRDQARPGRVERGQHLVADRAVVPDEREHLERHALSLVGAATTSSATRPLKRARSAA